MRYCTSVYKYLVNAAHECNVSPYCPLNQVMRCLLCTAFSQCIITGVVLNKHLITWFSGQYGETLHSCAAFSLAYGSGKYLYTLVQYLAIFPTKPGNEVFIMYCLLAMLATPTVTNFYVHCPAQNYLPSYHNELQKS